MLGSRNSLTIETQTIKRLEFLNLEFSEKAHRKNFSTDNFTLVCNIKDSCEHSLHTNNSQLNTLIDLVINLSLSLQKEITINKQIQSDLVAEIKKLSQNLDYIKDQTNFVIENKKVKPTENHISIEVEKLTEALQKLNIDKPKKPIPYKHWQPRK